MPEMSADVEHPNPSASAVEIPTATAPRAPAEPPQSPFTGEPKGPIPSPTVTQPPVPPAPETPLPPTADTPRWRLAAIGYVLLIVGFALALVIPHFRLRAGFREDALVILSIVAMLAAAISILAAFVLNLLRGA